MNERPPFLRSWRNAYALIIAVLIAEIAIMYWITRAFQ